MHADHESELCRETHEVPDGRPNLSTLNVLNIAHGEVVDAIVTIELAVGGPLIVAQGYLLQLGDRQDPWTILPK